MLNKIKSKLKSFSKQEKIAIFIMTIISLPIVITYGMLFKNAFYNSVGELSFENFTFLWGEMNLKQTVIPPIGQSLKNTVIFTAITTVVEVVISCMAGYAISRMEFRGKKLILTSILILRLFPGILLLIALMYILINLGIINSMMGVIIVAVALRLPASTFIIKGFFDNISSDIECATLVDGCTKISAFFQVIIHLVKPGIASITIFSFMSGWSNYLLFNTLIFGTDTPVLATYIRSLTMSDNMIADYGVFSAMAIIYMLPVIVFFFISQKQLMKGNVSGGKGL